MPEGVNVLVQDGFATLDFVDPKLKGPALDKLLQFGGPATIQCDTRSGPRKRYIVPEGNAREVGLLDEDNEVDSLPSGRGTSGTDSTGMVNPEGYTVAGQAHGPVLRQGTYRGGDNGNIDTVGSDPLPADIAATPHSDLVAQVGGVHLDHQPSGIKPGSVPAADNASAYIGMQGTGSVSESAVAPSVPEATKPYPDGDPAESWTRAELDAYAEIVKKIDTTGLGKKAEVVKAINAA